MPRPHILEVEQHSFRPSIFIINLQYICKEKKMNVVFQHPGETFSFYTGSGWPLGRMKVQEPGTKSLARLQKK